MLFKYLLYGLFFLFLIRLINAFRSTAKGRDENHVKANRKKKKRVSKDVGEYVDYEEVE